MIYNSKYRSRLRELSAGVVNAGWEVLWCHDYHVVKLTKENFMSTKIQRNQAIMTTEKNHVKITYDRKSCFETQLDIDYNSSFFFCNLKFLERWKESV